MALGERVRFSDRAGQEHRNISRRWGIPGYDPSRKPSDLDPVEVFGIRCAHWHAPHDRPALFAEDLSAVEAPEYSHLFGLDAAPGLDELAESPRPDERPDKGDFTDKCLPVMNIQITIITAPAGAYPGFHKFRTEYSFRQAEPATNGKKVDPGEIEEVKA